MTRRIESDDALEQAIFDSLAKSASVSPSAEMDRAIRTMLAGDAPFARPLIAAGLAAAACLALIAALSMGLADAGAAEDGPTLAILIVSGWMALSAAATLPLVLVRQRMGAARSLG